MNKEKEVLAIIDSLGRDQSKLIAILQDVQGPYVWVVGPDGKASRRSVARGDISGDWLFVEKGLKKGERIVSDGAHKVRKGMTVEPAPER